MTGERPGGTEHATGAGERTGLDDALLDQVLAAVGGPALVCDVEGLVRAWNGALADLADGTAADGPGGVAADEPGGETSLTATPVAVVVDWQGDDPVARAMATTEVASGTGRVAGGGRYEATARPLTADGVDGAVVTFDEADGTERTAGGETAEEDPGVTELERRHAELERLAAIQGLVQESVRALTGATTRAGIAETVCERLADSPFYEAAWVGSRDHSTGEVTPDHAAGDICEYLASVTVTADTGEHGRGPGGTAYRSGEIQVVDDVRDDPAFEPWREAALEHGLEGLAVVPLAHGSTTHGILAVYTGRPDAFGEREVAGFETLGEAVGFAMSATQQRRLLEADTLLELEFEVKSEGPFMAATEERDCRFLLDDAVLGRNGRVIDYLTVEGADPALGAEIARGFDTLESIRRLDGGDGPHFEMHWRESVFQYLAETGARGMRGVIEDGTGTMVVEAPGDIDVRQVTDAMLARFGEVELVAKRERETGDAAWWQPHGDIGATLTDRQRAVLQSAYYSGYYEWPRETDAEELADAMDVASTTLLQHLRKGHGRVLEALFDS